VWAPRAVTNRRRQSGEGVVRLVSFADEACYTVLPSIDAPLRMSSPRSMVRCASVASRPGLVGPGWWIPCIGGRLLDPVHESGAVVRHGTSGRHVRCGGRCAASAGARPSKSSNGLTETVERPLQHTFSAAACPTS
jgi:hypothetical protein